MKRIKNLTYHNLMRIVKMIMEKGYDETEAVVLAQKKFQDFNPNGMPIEEMISRMLTKEEYLREYGHGIEML